MKKLDEKLLIYKIRTRQDADAFGALYDRYVEQIYRFIFFKISHSQESEDLTSEVFLKAWNYLIVEQDRQVRSFSGLLYSIARNRVVDWYRDRAKAQECTLDEAVTLSSGPDAQERYSGREEHDRLLRDIRKLKQGYQEVILLRYVEELPVAEISIILRKKKSAVRVTLHRAMKKLKEITDQQTPTPPATRR